MGRWTQYDEDDHRLPEGMKRTGYDADTGRYYFIDRDGSVWQGAEGAEFSEMTRVSDPPAASQDREDDEDIEAAPMPSRADGYQPLSVDPTHAARHHAFTPTSPYRTLFPFFLIIAVVLLLLWRVLLAPILASGPSACPRNATPYLVQPGDTCWEIAQKKGCTLEELRTMNRKVECAQLMPGMTLCLPSLVTTTPPGEGEGS
ncbi:putative lysin motif containing protein [Lyophyllum shimeji]|uniref:Lysin motif containing protein n=1 Tax=Lyophyllum shimeji TaxID=47721 RepID=A0A9P3PY08_LYOSH|nr:putative lysin motif containing protein [Lyophyllum shimeji]